MPASTESQWWSFYTDSSSDEVRAQMLSFLLDVLGDAVNSATTDLFTDNSQLSEDAEQSRTFLQSWVRSGPVDQGKSAETLMGIAIPASAEAWKQLLVWAPQSIHTEFLDVSGQPIVVAHDGLDSLTFAMDEDRLSGISTASPQGWTIEKVVGKRRRLRSRYRWRSRLRKRLPWALVDLAGKGKDCGRHEWYNQDGVSSACYHCQQTARRI